MAKALKITSSGSSAPMALKIKNFWVQRDICLFFRSERKTKSIPLKVIFQKSVKYYTENPFFIASPIPASDDKVPFPISLDSDFVNWFDNYIKENNIDVNTMLRHVVALLKCGEINIVKIL